MLDNLVLKWDSSALCNIKGLILDHLSSEVLSKIFLGNRLLRYVSKWTDVSYLTSTNIDGTGQDLSQKARTFLRDSQRKNGSFEGKIISESWRSLSCTSCNVWLFVVGQTFCVNKCLRNFRSTNTSGILVL